LAFAVRKQEPPGSFVKRSKPMAKQGRSRPRGQKRAGRRGAYATPHRTKYRDLVYPIVTIRPYNRVSLKGVNPMRHVSRVVTVLLLAGGASLPASAGSSLDNTYWQGDEGCFILDLDFRANGEVKIAFDNGDDDTGSWRLTGDTLTIEFDNYGDKFAGTYDGDAIRASHSWLEEERDGRQSESCTFQAARPPSI